MHALKASLLAATFCCGLTSAVQAQSYLYDAAAGGLVDQQTGLVWAAGADLRYLTDGTGTYDYTRDTMPGLYMAFGHSAVDPATGSPYTDWRLATKAELLDGAGKGLYQALIDQDVSEFGPPTYVYFNGYWALDEPFREKGLWKAYRVSFDPDPTVHLGDAKAVGVGSICRCILVRGVAAPPPVPTKGKGYK